MTYLPRVAVATLAEWPDLVAELDRWREAGRVAPLWWRDDDATAPTAELARLLALADAAPLALAVIPAGAGPDLAAALAGRPRVAVLQHGWRHADHAAIGKKSEYPQERPPAGVAAELRQSRARLVALFAECALPVLVPPWNRFADGFAPLLAAAGLTGLSRMAARRGQLPGITEIDVHVDLVDWHGTRGFVGAGIALQRLLVELQARRRGEIDPAGAIGVLTHHLVMDAATAAFMAELTALVDSHRGARWVGVPELLGAR
jgi:hypothetical protein